MKIKKTVEQLVNQYNTRNPLEIADRMGISVTRDPLGDIQGYYLLYSGIKCICINSEIDDMNEIRIIAGHELGHAVLHETERCMFYPNTLFSRNKTELEANRFAAELLIPDQIILENPGMTKSQIARLSGYDERIMEFKKL